MADETTTQSPASRQGRFWAYLGPAVALFGIVLQIALALPFFSYPPGIHVREMGWAAMAFMVSAGTALLAVPLSISTVFICRRLRWAERAGFALTGVVLSVLPLPVAVFMLHLAADIRGFQLAE